MSLLREALKRQQQEQQAKPPPMPGKSPSPTEAPTTARIPPKTISLKTAARQAEKPSDKPPTPPVPPVSKASHDWFAKVLVVAGFLLLMGLLGSLYYLLRPRETPAPDAPVRPRLAETLRSIEETVTAPRPDVDEVVQPTDDLDGDVAERAADPPPSEPAPPVRAADAPARGRDERVDVDDIAPTPAVTPSPPAPRPESLPVTWPEIRIQAAMGHADRGSVLINGRIVAVGDHYEQVRIVEITDRGVLIEYEGEQRLEPVRR